MSAEVAIPISGTTESLRAIKQTTAAGLVDTEVVVDPNLTVSAPTAVSVTNADAAIIAATNGIRPVVVSVPTSADTGIYVNFDAVATSSNFLIEAGGVLKVNTAQAIHAIRAGTTTVTAYILTGVVP